MGKFQIDFVAVSNSNCMIIQSFIYSNQKEKSSKTLIQEIKMIRYPGNIKGELL